VTVKPIYSIIDEIIVEKKKIIYLEGFVYEKCENQKIGTG
jgi:hypothetical protein